MLRLSAKWRIGQMTIGQKQELKTHYSIVCRVPLKEQQKAAAKQELLWWRNEQLMESNITYACDHFIEQTFMLSSSFRDDQMFPFVVLLKSHLDVQQKFMLSCSLGCDQFSKSILCCAA